MTSDPSATLNGPQTAAQPLDPRDVIRDTIATTLNRAGYWLPVEGQRALADALLATIGEQAEAWRRTAVHRALAIGRLERTLELVEAAIHIADNQDITDWQCGYRACAERVQYALGHRDQPPTA